MIRDILARKGSGDISVASKRARPPETNASRPIATAAAAIAFNLWHDFGRLRHSSGRNRENWRAGRQNTN